MPGSGNTKASFAACWLVILWHSRYCRHMSVAASVCSVVSHNHFHRDFIFFTLKLHFLMLLWEFAAHSPAFLPWCLPGCKISAQLPADVYQVCSVYHSKGCFGLLFDMVIFVCWFVFVIFVINFISQLIRRLLGILRDWDFTRQQGDIQFF